MKAPDILKAAAGHMEDRAATYDKPEGERSMAATVNAFRCVTGHALTEEQGWLFMQLLKAVRSQQGGYRADSYEDGAAYASLAGEAAYRERCKPADFVSTGIKINIDPADIDKFTEAVGAASKPWEEGERRIDIIASSHGDGEHYAEDMSDPANWRAGDLVVFWEDVAPGLTAGKMYPLTGVSGHFVYLKDDDDITRTRNVNEFRFHSRPPQVNEKEMSGIWHYHGFKDEMPCDALSKVEVKASAQSAPVSFDEAQDVNWPHVEYFRML